MATTDDPTSISGDTRSMVFTLIEGFALLAKASIDDDPDTPYKKAIEDVLRRLYNHVTATDRTTDLLPVVADAWNASKKPH